MERCSMVPVVHDGKRGVKRKKFLGEITTTGSKFEPILLQIRLLKFLTIVIFSVKLLEHTNSTPSCTCEASVVAH